MEHLYPWESHDCRTREENERRLDAPLDSDVVGPTLQDCVAGKLEVVDPAEIHKLERSNPEATTPQATGSYSAEAGGS